MSERRSRFTVKYANGLVMHHNTTLDRKAVDDFVHVYGAIIGSNIVYFSYIKEAVHSAKH